MLDFYEEGNKTALSFFFMIFIPMKNVYLLLKIQLYGRNKEVNYVNDIVVHMGCCVSI